MKPSLYAKYLKEREGFEVLEDGLGFATYKIVGEECYIRDIYVDSDFRKDGVASGYCDQISMIAKEAGCKNLTTTAYTRAFGSTTSTEVIIRYGFRILSTDGEKIIFIKEIQ